jgi:hypothetical protein
VTHMSDAKEQLQRARSQFPPPEGVMESLRRRRDRKRRNQRIAAGVVGIAVFVAAVWIVTTGFPFDQSQTPAGSGPTETGPTSAGPRAKTEVTIHDERVPFGRAHLWGVVESTRPFKCAKDRNVIVFRQNGPEQHPQTDVEAASDRASLRGERYRWGLTLGQGNLDEGRYYARVRKTELCKADSSATTFVVYGGG